LLALQVNCAQPFLIIISGVSAQSFIQCFTLIHSAFTVQLATPGVCDINFLTNLSGILINSK